MEMIKVFIEIGSCDFDTCLDLVNTGEWTGVMVEPSPPYFKNLEKLVKASPYGNNVHLENTAITDYMGKIDFTVAKDMTCEEGNDVNGWVRGISSVSATNHKGERMLDKPVNQKFIDYHTTVPCMTLNALISKYKYEHINYLKIDTEGHELNILEAYDWDIKPDLIKIEHTHVDDIFVANLLKQHGYLVYTEQHDLYAIR